jgi:hypothetical protein
MIVHKPCTSFVDTGSGRHQILPNCGISCYSSMQHAVEGWYDAAALLPCLLEYEKADSLCGGGINDAETCDGIAAG